jgi:hypothetical protein
MHEGVIDKSEGHQGSTGNQVHTKFLQPMETRSHAVRNSILAWGSAFMSRACASEDLHRIKECFKAEKGYSIVTKIGCGQVNALRGLSHRRITKVASQLPQTSKETTTFDAAAGLCESGTKKLRRRQGRRAHYRFLRASCPVWRVVAWRPVTCLGCQRWDPVSSIRVGLRSRATKEKTPAVP